MKFNSRRHSFILKLKVENNFPFSYNERLVNIIISVFFFLIYSFTFSTEKILKDDLWKKNKYFFKIQTQLVTIQNWHLKRARNQSILKLNTQVVY